ncbi:Uncharacterised protein [Mycobacteroides abscessus subsp. abscessus]|uniref:helix-turn-helix transcriptional regulator n=1 Tax=Mycobacteroides abscessus TaxID=36809 RepID=UPI0009A89476|nr:helix-turn-helix domain-containing protein [Mycobacteroides abscessus]SLH66719.1 Uncharacterised protein [Mycobacteroides abscessus subsp. abscessus]
MSTKTDTLTSAETAALLGITPATLAARRHRGTSPRFTRTGHRTVVYRREDVEAFIAAGGEPTTAELARRVAELESRVTRLEKS